MARLVLVEPKTKPKSTTTSASSLTEGEEAKRLLMQHGFMPRRDASRNGQWEFNCPFHEEAGQMTRGQATNFYLAEKTSQFYCQAASCGERGNLQKLQDYFGVDKDPALMARFTSKNAKLQTFEGAIADEHINFLKTKGLTADTIRRFRIGYSKEHDAYVIPYLENRRPVAFRFYDPTPRGENDKGKTMYGGPNGSKYWWERQEDSIVTKDDQIDRLFNSQAGGGDNDGTVFICEGELKAMLLTQWGFAAVGIPGVSSYKQEWAHYFMDAREIVVVMDNDNPKFHKHGPCHKCETTEKDDCAGHNPGQDGAARLMDRIGYRGHNVVLPIPDGEKKTDINEYVMRDNHTLSDFVKLVTGNEVNSKYVGKTLAELRKNPPPEAVWIVDQLLPKGGRLLVTGAPKVGKSIFVENMVLSIAAGIPFLDRFQPANTNLTTGHRVLLLDRELSKRSLYDRFNQLIGERPGYALAEEKLIVEHDFRLAIDVPEASTDLINLIKENNAEVVVLDTAYKFFANGDIESSRSLTKAFANIDAAIQETGATFILTHHHRKGSNTKGEAPSADSVVGSFLWTGWSNGTILLNFKNRSVADPFTTVASFVAWRDGPAPEPLLLKRDRTSISYQDVIDFSFDEEEEQQGAAAHMRSSRPKLTSQSLADVLMQAVPVAKDDFMHMAAAHFGVKTDTIRPSLIDLIDNDSNFGQRGRGTHEAPYELYYTGDREEETYEESLGVPLDEFGQIKGQTKIEEALA